MTTTPLIQSELASTLKSLLSEQHRDFTVVFLVGKPRRFVAHYSRAKRQITIYPEHFENFLDMVGAGLHELSHHVMWNAHPALLRRRHRLRHGKLFRKYMDALLGTFNLKYREQFNGGFVWNRSKPTRSPRFVKFFSEFGPNL
jgi:hypothetical protein